ncbi:MAG TPA: DUF1353 domain-containing protein [Dehalococcoidales bacterium]|nr:MAG: hypothetical protein A2Z05_03740 [Chloroflexi bacterium RBG_16_60_22]HJX13044.1 DUF1353 domain-containing protein [Dehalococcoidales bacterium]
MSRFTEILIVSPLSDGRTWVTRKEFGYDVGEEGSGDTIEVPEGFMTDFASVPRPLWVFLPRWGKYGNAAVIHDYCYWEQQRTKRQADDIFREAMKVLEVPPVTSWFMYWAVRLFGGPAWAGNRKKRELGKTRVAAAMPVKSVAVPATLQAQE